MSIYLIGSNLQNALNKLEYQCANQAKAASHKLIRSRNSCSTFYNAAQRLFCKNTGYVYRVTANQLDPWFKTALRPVALDNVKANSAYQPQEASSSHWACQLSATIGFILKTSLVIVASIFNILLAIMHGIKITIQARWLNFLPTELAQPNSVVLRQLYESTPIQQEQQLLKMWQHCIRCGLTEQDLIDLLTQLNQVDLGDRQESIVGDSQLFMQAEAFRERIQQTLTQALGHQPALRTAISYDRNQQETYASCLKNIIQEDVQKDSKIYSQRDPAAQHLTHPDFLIDYPRGLQLKIKSDSGTTDISHIKTLNQEENQKQIERKIHEFCEQNPKLTYILSGLMFQRSVITFLSSSFTESRYLPISIAGKKYLHSIASETSNCTDCRREFILEKLDNAIKINFSFKNKLQFLQRGTTTLGYICDEATNNQPSPIGDYCYQIALKLTHNQQSDDFLIEIAALDFNLTIDEAIQLKEV